MNIQSPSGGGADLSRQTYDPEWDNPDAKEPEEFRKRNLLWAQDNHMLLSGPNVVFKIMDPTDEYVEARAEDTLHPRQLGS